MKKNRSRGGMQGVEHDEKVTQGEKLKDAPIKAKGKESISSKEKRDLIGEAGG